MAEVSVIGFQDSDNDNEDAPILSSTTTTRADKTSRNNSTEIQSWSTGQKVIVSLLIVLILLLGMFMLQINRLDAKLNAHLGIATETVTPVVQPKQKLRTDTNRPGTAAGWSQGKKGGPQFNNDTWKKWYSVAEKYMDKQWNEMIFPVIKNSDFSEVLEVAAGACRNTEYLIKYSDHIVITDIDRGAVESCKNRFANRPELKLDYFMVDGTHLPVPDNSISFVYQFDAGVHFHRSIIEQYVHEFARVLKPGGTGFFHHSNLGESRYPVESDLVVSKNNQWRSNMTKTQFLKFATDAGLKMLCHPRVTWGASVEIDAFALFYKPGLLLSKAPATCPEVI